jgi:CheY-like chemotaxis protein
MPAHILIIEDSEMSFALADYLLRQAGYRCSRADNGDTALRLALENSADLILCDLDLPGMDGYEVVKILRSDPAWRAVPLLAFTADSRVAANELRQAGFSGAIAKPVDPRTFTTELANYLPAELRAN